MRGNSIKPGVDISGVSAEIALIIPIVQNIFEFHGSPMVITSVLDGDHSLTSLHYIGHAIDFRTRTLATTSQKALTQDISDALGPQFDVILESNHLHIEFQPKK